MIDKLLYSFSMAIDVNPLDSNNVTEIITDKSELDSPLARLCQNRISGEEVVGLLQKYGIMPQLQRELIVDKAIEPVELTAEEIFGGYKAFYQQHRINSDEDRASWLECNHVTLSQFEHFVLRTLKLDRFKRETFASKVGSYFLQHKDRLDRASYTVLGVKSFYLAQELFLQVQDEGANFLELIDRYSEGQSGEANGLRGPHELSIPHPILADRLRLLKPGQMSAPLQISDWFILLRLEKYFPAQLDEKMQSRLIDELYDSWIQLQLNRVA